MKRFVILLCFLMSAASAIRSQEPKPSAPASVAVHAGKILDVRTRAYASDQMIWIQDGKIKAVGKPADINKQLPAGTKTIDLSNLTVLPGLIDCHTHLTFVPWLAGPARPAHVLSSLRAVRCAQCAHHAGSWFHNGSQCGRGWICGYRVARCHQ
jgi:hypothetical protein